MGRSTPSNRSVPVEGLDVAPRCTLVPSKECFVKQNLKPVGFECSLSSIIMGGPSTTTTAADRETKDGRHHGLAAN